MQNRTKGAETRSSKPAMYRLEMTMKRNFQKLSESPGVRYESVGRGFESLPSHQEKPEHVCVLVFLFVSTLEGARTGRRRIAPQAISPVQQRRPQPAAETGRSCWGRVLIFQSPAKGLQKNQQTQPVRPCTAGQAISPAGCCLVRGSQRVGMSNNRLRFTVRREDSSYPFLFFIQMRYSPSVMRVSRYRIGVQHASRMGMGRLPVA